MYPPTRVAYALASPTWTVTTSPRVSPRFNVKTGDVLVMMAYADGTTSNFAPTLSSGATGAWTQERKQTVGTTTVAVWSAVVTANGNSVTLSVTNNVSVQWNYSISVWRGSAGVAADAERSATGSTESAQVPLTTLFDKSVVQFAAADDNAQATRTWRTVGGVQMTEGVYGAGTGWSAYEGYVQVDTASTNTYGITQTAVSHTSVAIEIRGSTTAPAALSGTRLTISHHHYEGGVTDRQGIGVLEDFTTWTTNTLSLPDDYALTRAGALDKHGDRDHFELGGKTWTLYEGSINTNSGNFTMGAWRNFLYDPATGNATQLTITTPGGSTTFANPTATILADPNGVLSLLVCQFIPSEGAGTGEGGQMLYWNPVGSATNPTSLITTTAAGRRVFGLQDSAGHTMDTLQVVADPTTPGRYLGVYHWLNGANFNASVATSTNLTTWTFQRTLDTLGSQPYLAFTANAEPVLAVEGKPNDNLRVYRWATVAGMLGSASPINTFEAPKTLSSFAEGTPAIRLVEPALPPLVTVAASRASTWNVAAPVLQATAARQTAWTVIGPIGAARAASWTTAAVRSATRATGFQTLSGPIALTRATGWQVFALALPTTAVATPGMRLRVFLPNGADQGNLPTPESGNVAYPLNDVGALTFSYALRAPRASLLGQPCELAVEVTPDGGYTWLEPPNSRFVYVTDGADPIDPANKYSVQCKSLVWRLSKSVILPNNLLNADGKRAFLSGNVGVILKTLFNEAQARGAMTGIVHSSFSTTTDSAGAGWATTLTKYYEPGLNYLAVLQDLADSGLCDFKMQGRSLFVYNADTTLAVDRTVGATQVVFRAGRDLTEAPFTRTWEGLANYAYFAGDGVTYEYTDPGAITPWGRQELFISNGSVSDQGTMAVLTQNELAQHDVERVEYTRGLDFTRAVSRPFWDYGVGDYVWSAADGQAPARLRVRQMTLQVNAQGILSGNVVLNDRFLEADVRAKRRVDGITNGAQSGNGTGTPPVTEDPGGDGVAPGKVSGLVGTSAAYMGPGGFPQAQVSLSWSAIGVNADGTPMGDLDYYEIFERPFGQAESLAKQIATTTDTTWDNSPYQVGSNWTFNVGAVDTSGLRGLKSNGVNVGMATDTVAPQAPSVPIVTAKLGIIRVFWDGLPATGTWPPDFDHIEVHTSTVNNFTPTSATQSDTLYGEGASIVTNVTYGTPIYAKFIAVDKTPLKSVASAQGSATPARLVGSDVDPGAISFEQLAFKDPGNIVPDGSFETEQYRTLVDGRTGPAWSFTQTAPAHGLWSATCNSTVEAGTFRQLYLMDVAERQQIEPGDKLFCRMQYKGTSGANGLLQLVARWYTAAGVESDSRLDCTIRNNVWQQTTGQLTAPAGTVSFRIWVEAGTGATTGTFNVDTVEVRRTIGTQIIEDAAITNALINNLAVNSAKISDLDVGKLTAGTMSADVLVAGRLMTATSGNRVQMDSTGIRLYQGSNMTAHMDPVSGQLRIYAQGDISHTSTSHGLQLGLSNDENLCLDENEIMARFNGAESTLSLNREGGQVVIGGRQGGWPPGDPNYGDTPTGENWIIQLRGFTQIPTTRWSGPADEYAPFTIGRRGAKHLWFDHSQIGSSETGDAPGRLILNPPAAGVNHTAPIIMASDSLAIRRLSDANAGIYGYASANVGLQFFNGELLARTADFVGMTGMCANNFRLFTSAEKHKHSVEDIDDALDIVLGAPAKAWKYTEDLDQNQVQQFGPMLHDLPEKLRIGNDEFEGYGLGQMIGILWKAVSDLAEEVRRGKKP
jgi:hypothetical protein